MAHLTLVRQASAVSSTSNSTSWAPSWTWDTNTVINEGERTIWILICSADGNPTLNESGALWRKLDQETNGTAVTGAVWVLETSQAVAASAIPSNAPGITSSASEQYSAHLLAYKCSTGKSPRLLTTTKANGSSTNSNPAAVTNNSGASQDVTVIVTRHGDSTVAATSGPTNYTNFYTAVGGGSNGASTNSAHRQITIANSGSEDPGTFTSASEQWACITVGVYEDDESPDDIHYRFYNDDGDESTATAASNEDTNPTLPVGSNLHLRVSLQERAGRTPQTNDIFNLQYKRNAGAWTTVSTISTDVKLFNSANLTNGGATTQRLTSGTGSFVAGKIYETVNNVGGTPTANNFTELLYAVQIPGGGGAANGDTIQFRLQFNGLNSSDGMGVFYYPAFTTLTVGSAMPSITAAPGSYALTGTAAIVHRVMAAALATYALTGTDATFAKGRSMTADPATYTYTGTDATFQRTRVMPADVATYTYTGTATGLLRNRLVTADPGTYTFTGTAANFLRGRVVIADPGTYTLTGTAANLLQGHLITAAPATYSLTGTDVTFTLGTSGYFITADPGSYALTGTAANFLRGLKVIADPGTYSLTGTPASTLHGYRLVAEQPVNGGLGPQQIINGDYSSSPGGWTLSPSTGTMNITGGKLVGVATEGDSERFDAESIAGRVYLVELDVDSLSAGLVSVVFGDVEFLKGSSTGHRSVYGVASGSGSYAGVYWYGSPSLTTATVDNFSVREVYGYALTGTDVSFTIDTTAYTMAAAPGTYSLTGTAANLLHGWTMPAVPGSYTLTGTQADLERGLTVAAAPGSYSLTGTPANWFRTYQMLAVAGSYTLNGTAVTFPRDISMVATAGAYALTGTPTGFRYWRISPVPGVYLLTGWSVDFSEGTLADIVPENDPLIVFRHNEPEVVRVPKLNAVAKQAAIKRVGVVSMAQLATIGPAMGLQVHVWNAPGGYAPAYADGFNWRKVSDDTILI